MRRNVLRFHPAPLASELLRDQHGQGGQHALPHLGARYPNDGGIICSDDDPDRYLGSCRRRLARCALKWNSEAERKRSAERGGARKQ